MSVSVVSGFVDYADSDLVSAVRAGDDDAFEELYRRYRPRISGYVHGLVRDHGRAEDVTQEAFLSALRRMRQTDSEIAFKPWIYEIARNAAIDLYRRTSRTEEVSIAGDDGLAPADAGRLVGFTGPDSALIDKERFEHLRGALDELSETHHRIIVMRELEGLAYREIAERMELTRPAVESTLFRARRKLEHEYEEIETGRRCNAMGAVIARLAEGVDSKRERRRLDRHARRCSSCRRRARELGVEPLLERRVSTRAAALLPLPGFMRRRGDVDSAAAQGATSSLHHGVTSLAPGLLPGLEASGAMWSKAAATIAAAVVVGAGGASLGGAGPLALTPERVAPVADASSTGVEDRGSRSAPASGASRRLLESIAQGDGSRRDAHGKKQAPKRARRSELGRTLGTPPLPRLLPPPPALVPEGSPAPKKAPVRSVISRPKRQVMSGPIVNGVRPQRGNATVPRAVTRLRDTVSPTSDEISGGG